jgi:hypothetical protein
MRVLALPDEDALKAIAPLPTAEKVGAEEA